MNSWIGIWATSSLLILGSVCAAQVQVLNTHFQAEEGYHDGDLQFQSITNGTEGTWQGHSGGTVTTSGVGTFARDSDPRRNLFSRGATGGLAGGDGSGESHGLGFGIGDVLTLRHGYTFEHSGMPITGLLKAGVRPDYVSGGFESLPLIGISLEYVHANGGQLQIYGNLSRSASKNSDQDFAVIVNASDIGLNNSGGAGQIDELSDPLILTWIGVYTDTDTWRTQEMILENVSTAFSAKASVVNPASLEQVTIPGSGAEAFFGMQQLQDTSGVGVTDFVDLRFNPASQVAPGSYDGDFDVDGMDLLFWQRGRSSPTELIIWQSLYGRSFPGEISKAISVPEPSGVAIATSGLAAVALGTVVFKLKGEQKLASLEGLL